MTIWDIIEKIERVFGKALENWVLYYALIVIVFIFILVIVIIGVLWIRGTPPENVTDAYRIINEKATSFCNEQGFNAYKLIGREMNSNAEDKQTENLTFECYNSENVTDDVRKYFINSTH